MRDPNRLDGFYHELKELHKNSFPDWRFGQLMYNFMSWLSAYKGVDCFFPEEKKMLQYLYEFQDKMVDK